ncbi:hypothetical protein Sjap_004978 [Stephania japonica]|uniref:Uncharacterized protein n=1 Tax=Stephania japonica TaxID=461633 RepID=A0AAP0PKQ1_9MAGN
MKMRKVVLLGVDMIKLLIRAKRSMVRGKTQVKRIENTASRQVTFSKRRNGLMKKAYELSVLCDVNVGLIVFSPKGKLYDFASSSMHHIIERYQEQVKDVTLYDQPSEQNIEQLQHEAAKIAKRIEVLEASQRNLTGECLSSCSIDELHELEKHLEKSLTKVRGKKNHLLDEHLEQLRENCELQKAHEKVENCAVEMRLFI